MVDESIYVLYDRVAVARTGNLVVGRSDAAMVRLFNDLLAQDERLGKHADDYEMRKVGIIDEQGEITPCVPVTVATGSQWRASQMVSLVKEGTHGA